MSTKRVSELESRLREASVAYYVDDNPVMSDAEFDKLKDELAKLDPDNEFLTQVGAPLDSSPLVKVQHEIRMGSLNKVNTEAEYNTWLKSVEAVAGKRPMLVLQWKMDGSSVELIYRKGKFVRAITRGNGKTGEDVTHTIKNAKGLPLTLKHPINCSVRAEAYLGLKDWDKYLSGETKNPRNAAAGIVRRTDSKDSNLLNIQAYDITVDGEIPIKGGKITTEKVKINFLINLGFEAVQTSSHFSDEIPKQVAAMEKQREDIDFEVDGAVVTVNDIDVQEKMGEHKGLPYFARAWKFEPDAGISKILNVLWTMGSRGTIHPTAEIEPVEVCGVTISNVSLHNLDIIEKLGIQIGDEVEVVRAGDVIPKIIRLVKKGSNRKPIEIKQCPSCGKKVVRDGPFVRCPDADSCFGVQIKRIGTFISKREIMHLGDSNLALLMDGGKGPVKNVAGLYRLDKMSMENAGVGEGMTKKILAEIEKSRDVSLADLIGSLSIDLCGRSEAANIVACGIDTLKKWKTLTAEQLVGFPGFKGTKASRICESLKNSWDAIEEVASYVRLKEGKPVSNTVKEGSFLICLTGTMSRPRKDIAADIEAAGHKVADAVSTGVTHLCQADPSSQSTKSKKAQKMGIPVISEEQLLALLR